MAAATKLVRCTLTSNMFEMISFMPLRHAEWNVLMLCADQLQAATPSFKLDHPFIHASLPQWQSELQVNLGLRELGLPRQMHLMQFIGGDHNICKTIKGGRSECGAGDIARRYGEDW